MSKFHYRCKIVFNEIFMMKLICELQRLRQKLSRETEFWLFFSFFHFIVLPEILSPKINIQ